MFFRKKRRCQTETEREIVGKPEIGKRTLSNPFLEDFMNVKILQSTNYIT